MDAATSSDSWPGHTGNWNRWDNDRGTLNLITADKVAQATREVTAGIVFPCARPIQTTDPTRDIAVARHEMVSAGRFEGDPERDASKLDHQSASDTLWMRLHGMVNTHSDALAHVGVNGLAFNGRPFEEVVSMEGGAAYGSITDTLGVVTRGVIADIPRLRGIDYLEPGDSVRASELESTTPQLSPGDALVIRTGGTLIGGVRPDPGDENFHGRWGGLHPDCMDYIREKDVAVLATDSPGDTFPSPIPESDSPIHVLALAYLGLHVVHNMDLEALADYCVDVNRASFLFIVSALNIPHGTGSPVTPLAIL